MLEQIILGIIQGVVEWLPVSSEGILTLIQTNFLGSQSIRHSIQQALFLHGGTFLAAAIYFRKDIVTLIKSVVSFKKAKRETKNLFAFLIISTIVSGILGITLLQILSHLETQILLMGKAITLIIGLLLIITGFLQIKTKETGKRKIVDLSLVDSIFLGIAQGLASLPGFSRSGLTVSALLLRNFRKELALKISFLMSLPIVLGGNILLNFDGLFFTTEALVGLITSFVFGLITIHLLLKLASRINFGFFVLIFGAVTIGLSLF